MVRVQRHIGYFCLELSTLPCINTSPEYARLSIEKALKTLGVDCIDLFYLHRPDVTVPIEHMIGAMAEFVKAGKVKYLGISDPSASTLRRAHAVHPISAVQVEYSPFTLDIEDPKIGLLDTCRELGITVVVAAYSPLGRGMLADTLRSHYALPEKDHRRNITRYSEENFPNILKLVDGIPAIGAKYNCASSNRVTLAWLLAQGPDIIPIPGTKQFKYLEDALKLSDEDIAAIRQLAKNADIKGSRLPVGYNESTFCFVDTPELK
ncbi:NADP-dependent oxidoreductase domain-containing protein [Mycena epipterygia]|nr:NADP-dependent oxidoreductase domain-containing protein [Mycena epipterygia]